LLIDGILENKTVYNSQDSRRVDNSLLTVGQWWGWGENLLESGAMTPMYAGIACDNFFVIPTSRAD
jgi:hypothetical protein